MARMLRDVNTGELYSYNVEMAKLDYMEEVSGENGGETREFDADAVVDEENGDDENGEVATTTTSPRPPRARRR